MNDKPTIAEISEAVVTMAETIPFFPHSGTLDRLITAEITSMVSTKKQLDWLVISACRAFTDWGKTGNLPALRALFCSQFEPADKIQASCPAPAGFRAEDYEAQSREREMADNDRRLAEYRRLAAIEGHKPLELPGEVLKSMNPPPPPTARRVPRYTRDEILAAEAELASAERKPAKSEAQKAAEIHEIEKRLKGF